METIVSPMQRVHVVAKRSGQWVICVCGVDFPARTVWPADGLAITCKPCRTRSAMANPTSGSTRA